MRQAEMFFSAEKTEIRELLSAFTLYFMPMANPDGVEICLERDLPDPGLLMRYPNIRTWKANARGVDLNENYPCLWKQKRSYMPCPASEGFKGYEAASENEVKCIMKFCLKNDIYAAMTFHAKGEEIYYADKNSLDSMRFENIRRLKMRDFYTGVM